MVVFVNGLGGAQAAFMLQVRDFSRDHRVLTFDHRGIGGSAVVDAPAHMDFAADLVRRMKSGPGAWTVGLSFGGRVLQCGGRLARARASHGVGRHERRGALHHPGNVDAHGAPNGVQGHPG